MRRQSLALTRLIYETCFPPGEYNDGGQNPSFDTARDLDLTNYQRAKAAAAKITVETTNGRLLSGAGLRQG